MPQPDADSIAILGGTGDQGLGLALRFAKAGRKVVIGSRKEDRALAAAKEGFWKRLLETGNDPFPYSSNRCPSLLFSEVQFSGA